MTAWQPWSAVARGAGLVVVLAVLAGCATQAPEQGYGAQGTAAQAQAQMQLAEAATEVNTAQTYLNLITQMQQAGQWYASLAHTEAFEREHGATPDILLRKADALRNTQQYDAARHLYTGLLNTPQAGRAYRGIGLLHGAQGQFDAAISALEHARQRNPVDADVLSDLAYAYLRSGRLDEARVPVQQSAQLAPGNARVQLNLALFWLASGAQEQASQLLYHLTRVQKNTGQPLADQAAVQGVYQQLLLVQQAVAQRSQAQLLQYQVPQPQEQASSQASVLPKEDRQP